VSKLKIAESNSCVSHNIVKIINEKGLKQCAVAKKAGMKIQEFNAMLNGRKIIKPYNIPPIAEALGVTPNDLFNQDKTA
jgi:transcriptional regulator with XRE-family HTH domain